MIQIKVIFQNGCEDAVPHYALDHFIQKKKIVAFERTEGWVHIGHDPIRNNGSATQYSGVKRRITDYPKCRRKTDYKPFF